jgi:hypothetical protein
LSIALIRSKAVGVTWAKVSATPHGLAAFVRESNLPYGVKHKAEITNAFISAARSRIEAAFGPWKGA